MILVVGATGLLGGEVVRLLRQAGHPVRALTRATSLPARVEGLRALGAELAIGDLKDRAAMEAALRGVTRVVSTASVTLSRQAGDSIETVDQVGQLRLVDLARAAGVEHFVFVSFPALSVDCALQRAKRAVEVRLAATFPSYTVLQPVNFSEIWLSPAVGFDLVGGTATIFGTGKGRNAWISYRDVAGYTVEAALTSSPHKLTVPLGGPDALSQLEVVELFSRLSGRDVALTHVSAAELELRRASATDQVDEAFAALMLNTAAGWLVDASLAHRTFPRELTTVASYVRSLIGS